MKPFGKRAFAVVALLLTIEAAAAAGQAQAQALRVCPSGCPFAQIGPALAAASGGDTIAVGAGAYTGGFTIDSSVRLVGAGAGRTVISGGGPVITIGTFGAASEPTVSIAGVTITGGVTHASPQSALFFGQGGVIALGGGIDVPPAANFAPGATVTIADSVISGNRAEPSTAIDSGLVCPPDITITCINGDLPFALAAGGGIDNWGTMTLTNTTVSNNQVGGPTASDADGAGINSVDSGGLTLVGGAVRDNSAIVTAPNGRFADSGGVFIAGGTLSVSDSSMMGNSARVVASMPSDIPGGTAAAVAGMHVTGNTQRATISHTKFTGNTARDINSLGDATAFSGGLHNDIDPSNFSLSNDVIANNHVVAMSLASGQVDGGSGAGELSGTLSNVRMSGNSVDVHSEGGSATAEGGASVFDGGSISNSLITDNHVHVSSPGGSAVIRGAAIFVAVSLTLRNSTVSSNTADVSGANGSARGGGIFDAAFPFGPDGPPGGPLVLQNSELTANALTGSAAFTLNGGGLYIQNEPLTSTNTDVANNTPDQCFGC